MLARIRKSMQERDQGFTLIELLVVMIIIGILAAIAIPVFLSQREKARDTSTKADVSTVGKEIAAYYVDGQGELSVAIADGVATLTVSGGEAFSEVSVSEGTEVLTDVTYTEDTAVSEGWCVAFTNPNGDQQNYQFSATGGLAPGTCTVAVDPED